MNWRAQALTALLIGAGWFMTVDDVSGAQERCVTLFDFAADPDDARRWQTVNDGVMGGRSRGGFSVEDGLIRFSGVINTNGGGFSSIRARVPATSLAGNDVLKLKVRADARDYRVNLQTDVGFRGRPVSYTAPIRVLTPGKWQESTVFLSELQPTVFGQRVSAPPFEPRAASVISIILSDGLDGPFSIDIERVRACRL